MIRKKGVLFIWLIFILLFGVHTYAAKSGTERVVLATVYFEIGSAEIKPEFEKKLKNVQAALEADKDMGLHIVAYGYQQSASPKNRELVQKRARAIQQWFAKNGIEKTRLIIKSHSGAEPAAKKDGPKITALSERVEILQVSFKQPLALLPAARYEFEPVVEGQEVRHDFVVQNKGSAPLDIRSVKTD